MSVFDWPASLVPLNVSIRPPRKTRSMTGSLTDSSQVVPAIRPPFGMTIEFDTLFGQDVLAYRAMLGLFEGRANFVRVPMFDLWFGASAAEIHSGGVLHSDGTSFSDAAAYLTTDIVGVLVTGVQGQRTITADFGSYGHLLDAGLYFGLGDNPYLCTGIAWTGSVASIRCTPTLRRDYTAEPLRLRPVMIGQLKDDDNGEHVLKAMRSTTPTLDLVEVPLGLLS
jgi:hypothetical protein